MGFDLCSHAALLAPGDARLAKAIAKPHLHLRASYFDLNCRFGLYWIASKVAGTTTHVWQIWLTSITQTLQTCIKPINAAKTRKHRRLGFHFDVLRLKLVKLVKQLYPKYICFLYLIHPFSLDGYPPAVGTCLKHYGFQNVFPRLILFRMMSPHNCDQFNQDWLGNSFQQTLHPSIGRIPIAI